MHQHANVRAQLSSVMRDWRLWHEATWCFSCLSIRGFVQSAVALAVCVFSLCLDKMFLMLPMGSHPATESCINACLHQLRVTASKSKIMLAHTMTMNCSYTEAKKFSTLESKSVATMVKFAILHKHNDYKQCLVLPY